MKVPERMAIARILRFIAPYAALLVALVVILYFAPDGGDKRNTAIVTFTFDDGSLSQYEHGLRLAKAYGIRGTLFVNSNVTSLAATRDERWNVTWAEVGEFRDAGWEIGSHSATHANLTELDEVMVRLELAQAFSEIESHVGIAPVSFAAPFGAFNPAVLAEIGKRHAINLRAWGEHDGRNAVEGLDLQMVERFDVAHDVSAEHVCGLMTQAATNGDWLVFMIHEVVDHEAEQYQLSTAVFEEILSCAQRLEKDGLIRIEPVREAAAFLKPAS